MYRIKAILKSGVTITIAETETDAGAEKILDELELEMIDPTVAKHIFRNGFRMTVVKDISTIYVEEDEQSKELY